MTRHCDIDGCSREHAARGLCAMHYYRAQRSGNAGDAAPLTAMPGRGLTLAEHLDIYRDRSGGPDACWEYGGTRTRQGYGQIQHDGRRMGAHRAAWEAEHGPIPEGMAVRHKVCDNPPCCNPAHLRIGTHERNMRDKVQAGRQFRPSGEGNGSARLTAEQVSEMRSRHADGALQRELGEQFGVSQSTVSEIVNRKKWKDAA